MNEEQLLANIFGETYTPDGTEDKYIKSDLCWGWCRMCGPYLKCPKCGNNSCNGMYGFLDEERKQQCDLCPSIYELANFLKPPTKEEFLTGD